MKSKGLSRVFSNTTVKKHQLPQIVLRAFMPGPYPKHAAHISLSSPCSLVADKSVWATSPLGVAVRHRFCGFFFFFFFFWLCCPLIRLETPKLPTDPLMRGFLGVWKLLLLHNSLPGKGLCSSFVSLFVFYILSYLLSKRMCCLSGCLVSSASV